MARALDNVFQMDRAKLMKLITNGLVLAVLGLAIMIASKTIAVNASSIFAPIDTENTLNYFNNFYGYAEWLARDTQLTQSQSWLVAAMYLVKTVGQIALLFGLLLALVGLLGSAINPQNDDKMRLVCMITCAVLIFVLFYGFFGV